MSLAATDELSGVATTSPRSTARTAAEVDGPVSGHRRRQCTRLRFWSTDVAGNVESEQTATVSVDDAPPTIAGTSFPAANAKGWNNTAVDVTFTCDDAHSGIASCGPNAGVTADGKNQVVEGTAVDKVGNTASASATVNIDTQTPVTSAALPPAGAAGWYTGTVPVTLDATDNLSGVDCDVRLGRRRS